MAEYLMHPYYLIELSADTEADDDFLEQKDKEIESKQVIAKEKEVKIKKKEVKVTKSVRKRGNELMAKSSKLIQQKLNIMDFHQVFDEFQRMTAEVNKNQARLEIEGSPTLFLKTVNLLHSFFYDKDLKLDQKKKKESYKVVNQIKKVL